MKKYLALSMLFLAVPVQGMQGYLSRVSRLQKLPILFTQQKRFEHKRQDTVQDAHVKIVEDERKKTEQPLYMTLFWGSKRS